MTRAAKIGSANVVFVARQHESPGRGRSGFGRGAAGYLTGMWFALGTPVVLMVAAVLMERFEQHCSRVPARAEGTAERPEKARDVPRPVVAQQVALPH
ncbi:hypothetical protein AB0K15_31570 [Amycolatopsis sp. NPDC049253]|uniref:hypothetical protein n=1 Tax=Amycolatopsis sp. NPDC049253 TaxID=3155274 RepID=UPI00344602A5